ncbi:MAG: lipoyl(octanoyl) transferase LipB [Deltaproteobacteria bacterium]|nr:lipoyl(octanoyl) transferase LipB [Deltaproteobacteria bacterium]
MTANMLEILEWGRLRFSEAWERQLALVEQRVNDSTPDRLVLVEHPPVITIGRSGGPDDLKRSEHELTVQGVELQRVERGGQATYHGPGQMVAYPIIKLRQKDLHLFLRTLLEAAANTIRSYGLEPEFKEGRPGLWVESKKISSVGLAVRRWVTYHGLALNVGDCLGGFQLITPCGNPSEKMTSLEELLGVSVNMAEVKERFILEFCRSFEYQPQARFDQTSDRLHPRLTDFEHANERIPRSLPRG